MIPFRRAKHTNLKARRLRMKQQSLSSCHAQSRESRPSRGRRHGYRLPSKPWQCERDEEIRETDAELRTNRYSSPKVVPLSYSPTRHSIGATFHWRGSMPTGRALREWGRATGAPHVWLAGRILQPEPVLDPAPPASVFA